MKFKSGDKVKIIDVSGSLMFVRDKVSVGDTGVIITADDKYSIWVKLCNGLVVVMDDEIELLK